MDAFADPLEGVDTIYHYTSLEGLKGIIETHEIWLTNTEFVNDTTECKALSKIDGLLDKVKNPYLKDKVLLFSINYNSDNDTYISSFSKVSNSLEQWRAYGNYCIGFEAKKLIKSNFNLYECVYEEDAIKRWILEKSKINEWEEKSLGDLFKKGAAMALLYHASKKYKNKHYKNEEEIRLIVTSNHKWRYENSPEMYKNQPPIHFRDHPIFKVPVPYVKFFVTNEKRQENKQGKGSSKSVGQQKEEKREKEMNQKKLLLPIKEIWIGPMVHQEKANLACEILLNEKGYKDFKVFSSEIPYRGF